jgi:hypothetical protein
MILSYSLDVKQLSLDILFKIKSNMIFSALVITLIWLQNLSKKHGTFGINGVFFYFIFTLYPYWIFVKRDKLLSKMIKFKYEKLTNKRMSIGSCVTSKLYDKIIKMPSKSHETIPLKQWLKFIFRTIALIISHCTVV